ncbi:lytic transglycosylase domain-containing protein [Lelliottia sp. SL45]|uniref:lytic transglycosylase domain-containing protein n=1 Tax=Lelliottia sp. SL45 TaxID=2994665 RepID=UPI002274903F|nr:lytic transglycosylase domain-containing protein [Lelliottia sp. SL45]MCY1699663.1 lytic transglycosylase domain-containing protein [Lelliottia sp. SL45]
MAGNGVPVLQLDFDDEKIKRLNEIADKFRSALSIGPGGFSVNSSQQAPGGGQAATRRDKPADSPTTSPPSQATTIRQRDEKGRFIPGQTPAAVPADPAQQSKPGFFSKMFTRQYSPAKNETDKFFNDFNKQGKQTKKTFDEIDKSLKVTTTSLEKLFKNTVTWGARVLALGAGGTFGYNYMASKVAEQYAGAQGLGISTGQQQAARNVYGGRITGAENILQSLANAQNDPSNPMYAAMVNMGIDPKKGAAQNLPQFLQGVSKILQQYKGTGVSQQALKGHGLDGVIDVATANQIIANSDRLPQLNQQFGEQSQRLDAALGPETMASYQDVSAKFADNASRIGNSFINAIARLNGPIGQLSDNLTSSIEKFLNGRNGKALFDTIASGLQQLGDWIGGDSFQSDLKSFADCVKTIVTALGDAIHWIAGNVPGVNLNGAGVGPEGANPTYVAFGNKYLGGKLPGANPMTNQYTGEFFKEEDVSSKYQMPDALKTNVQTFVEAANKAANLPAGLMPAIAGKESSWNPLALNKSSGAAGLFQFMPSTAKAYGLEGGDVFDPNKSTVAAGKYLNDLNRRYGGDVAKMLTSYNGGKIDSEGNLSLRKETVDYLIKILPQVQGALDQHPGIMNQLGNARDKLASGGKDDRATINLQISQVPGSDIAAQVKGITLARR